MFQKYAEILVENGTFVIARPMNPAIYLHGLNEHNKAECSGR